MLYLYYWFDENRNEHSGTFQEWEEAVRKWVLSGWQNEALLLPTDQDIESLQDYENYIFGFLHKLEEETPDQP